MTSRARAFRQTHQPDAALDAVLPDFHRAVEDGASAESLARTVHLPVAAVRGAYSSYTDTAHHHEAIRVCAGTSCMLSGGGNVAEQIGKSHRCHGVYCLGYCDRSPAAMTPQGNVVANLTAESAARFTIDARPSPPLPPSVRCTAPHAIVTGRLAPLAETAPRYEGLHAALAMTPRQVIEAVLNSGLKGRGGAAFSTGRKWQLAAQAAQTPKFIVANGDEGDPGSFVDRELMERDAHSILEGMAIAAHAVGASRGVVFIRAEYPAAAAIMTRAIDQANAAGLLGPDALGTGRGFEVEVVNGLGSYVCGEETALLAAIEGQRGEVRPRPPFPVEQGLFGRPTVVDNVETLVNVPWIMLHGTEAFARMGTAESKGTKSLCFNRGFAKPGIVEIEFGMSLRSAIEDLGGGGGDGKPLEAVLLGGPMGSIVTPDQWDVPICFTAMARRGINLGHGGLVAIAAPADWPAVLRHLLTFMRDESCGKCTPCRLGSLRAHELATSGLTTTTAPQFRRIMDLMRVASLCAFGRETPGPVRTILEKFGDRIVGESRP